MPAPRDDVLGVAGLGVHRVRGDDASAQVESFQQWGEGGDFVALRGDLPLGDDGLALVQDGGEEVDGCPRSLAAAAYGLAVDGHPHQLGKAVGGRVGCVSGQPGAHGAVQGLAVQTRQQTAQGGRARQTAQPDPFPHIGSDIDGVAGDAGQCGGATEHREQAQGEQRPQPIAAAPHPSRIRQPVQHVGQRSEFGRSGRQAQQVDVPVVALENIGQGGWHANATPVRDQRLREP
ncbi:hypothetical protein GCM10020367_35100 [Streptomyces sannanensis]|uniref:Uncharacterized protein n=1 Tax=Streptomyces sannanensis TaxID=285536 RepID=A0ABP6SDR8_9ACTN